MHKLVWLVYNTVLHNLVKDYIFFRLKPCFLLTTNMQNVPLYVQILLIIDSKMWFSWEYCGITDFLIYKCCTLSVITISIM